MRSWEVLPREFLAEVRRMMEKRGVKVELGVSDGMSETDTLDQLDKT